MIDNSLKNLILLRHADFDNSSKSINFYGFMETIAVAEYLRNNKYPLPNAFVASAEKRTAQVSKIISSSLTRAEIPIFQERMIYWDALCGTEDAVKKNGLKDSSFLITVSHHSGLESSLKRLNYEKSVIYCADTFLLTAPSWADMFSINNNIRIKHLISPAQIRFFDKPGFKEIESAFEERSNNCDIDKIPQLLEHLRTNQSLRNLMINILDLSVSVK
ncbi:MAG: hypothetical protein LBJ73_01405 [Rickettsiales bacterium]|jgi:phosphohistidine phosphatase SixA|nr:hypothetical protein [Rickettsiales bacterium]